MIAGPHVCRVLSCAGQDLPHDKLMCACSAPGWATLQSGLNQVPWTLPAVPFRSEWLTTDLCPELHICGVMGGRWLDDKAHQTRCGSAGSQAGAHCEHPSESATG